jgi:hypothetical protein
MVFQAAEKQILHEGMRDVLASRVFSEEILTDEPMPSHGHCKEH